MIQSQRREKILGIINSEKNISVKQLSSKLGFAESTIRGDLNFLDGQGLAKRTHGGATAITSTEVIDFQKFEHRLNKCQREKTEIALKAIETIHNNECIAIDASTTCYQLAKILAKSDLRLTIITNGIKVVEILKENPNLSVYLVGGRLAQNSYALEGDFGVGIFDNFNINKTFISSHYINIENGMSDFNIQEVQLKKHFVKNANKIFALIDSSKFDKVSTATICNLDEIDMVITDSKLKEKTKKEYEEYGLYIDNLPKIYE